MNEPRADDTITVLDAYRSMRLFLYRFWERGGFRSDELRLLLSWTSLRSWSEEGEVPLPGDPAQWPDWTGAVHETLNGTDPDDLASPV